MSRRFADDLMANHGPYSSPSGDFSAQGLCLACPCCSSVKLVGYWALMAPFIRALVQPAHSSLVGLAECRACGHRFFSYQYTDKEMGRLYGGYRGEHYFLTRHRHEPWYGRKANAANFDPSLIRARQDSLVDFLRPFLPRKEGMGLVIADLGGDAGQFLPLLLAKEAYLVEASEQIPVDGVTLVADLAAIPSDLDLLICAHVLEHIPAPIPFLRANIASSHIRSGCLIYLEVPLERYGIAGSLGSQLYCRYLLLLSRSRLALLALDFLSVLARSYLGWIFPPLIIKMHEHVNFFTAESLQACIQSLGLELLATRQDYGSSLSTHQGVIRILAQKR